MLSEYELIKLFETVSKIRVQLTSLLDRKFQNQRFNISSRPNTERLLESSKFPVIYYDVLLDLRRRKSE